LQLIEFATRKIPLTAEIRVGTPAPDFKLPDLHGRSVFLSQFRGQSHVVLMFGSITCCATVTQLRADKPTMRSLYTRYRKKRFEFFLVYSRETHSGELIPQGFNRTAPSLHAATAERREDELSDSRRLDRQSRP
jgi:hypothetical protein